jgi:hypothetical protein
MEGKSITSPLKAARSKCLDCCNGSPNEVKLCPAEDCPLHPFRFGKNPFRKIRNLSDEEREALAERGRNVLRNLRSITDDSTA